MLTKILVAAAFLCLGVVAYGFLDALGAAETPGDAGVLDKRTSPEDAPTTWAPDREG